MRKFMILLVVLVLFGTSLAPVASQTDELSGNLSVWGVAASWQPWIETAIERFTAEHPNVTIEVTAQSGGGTNEVIPI